MKDIFTITATARGDTGKGASRRLRHADRVPAIVYGAGKKPENISVEHNVLNLALQSEAFYTRILTLNVDGKQEKVILRDLQRHPFKPRILHMDLQRISATEKLTMRIPLHFKGGDVAPGVKLAGGLISHLMSEVEVRCLPADLPEFIEVDLSSLELNQAVHLSSLVLPKGVEIVELLHGEDKPVATVYIPRAVVEEEVVTPAGEVPVVGEEAKAEGEEGAAEAKPEAGEKEKDKEKDKSKK
jgi:large subunit ribosomal protein L25